MNFIAALWRHNDDQGRYANIIIITRSLFYVNSFAFKTIIFIQNELYIEENNSVKAMSSNESASSRNTSDYPSLSRDTSDSVVAIALRFVVTL